MRVSGTRASQVVATGGSRNPLLASLVVRGFGQPTYCVARSVLGPLVHKPSAAHARFETCATVDWLLHAHRPRPRAPLLPPEKSDA